MPLDEKRLILLERLSVAAHRHAVIARQLMSTAHRVNPLSCPGEFVEVLREAELARAEVHKARAEFDEHSDKDR